MRRRRVDGTLAILLVCLAAALAIAWSRGADLPWRGVAAAGRQLSGVWPELLVGFLLAGLVEVLLPAQQVARLLGDHSGARGILYGWAIGLLLPGGPYLAFPIVAQLSHRGATPGALITLLTAKTLVSPLRMITYEAPLLGWPLTLARCLPALLVAPLLGLLGHWLVRLFR